jgi:hypothetical protein
MGVSHKSRAKQHSSPSVVVVVVAAAWFFGQW